MNFKNNFILYIYIYIYIYIFIYLFFYLKKRSFLQENRNPFVFEIEIDGMLRIVNLRLFHHFDLITLKSKNKTCFSKSNYPK